MENTSKWYGWTCIRGRICGGAVMMEQGEKEIEQLRGLLSEILPYMVQLTRDFVELNGASETDWINRVRSALQR
jgi:hypothetical protein